MPRLFVLGGPDAGATHDVTGPVALGRSPECQVRLRHPSVSRRHAELAPDGDAWIVKDLDSRNGLRHGGQRVKRARLADGDEFVLGELPLRLRFSLVEPAPAASVEPAAPAPPRVDEPSAEGLELEGEEFLSETVARPAPEIGLGDAAGAPSATGAKAGAGVEASDAPELDDRARMIFEMQRKSRGGALSADLAQRPWAIRMVLYLLAAGFALALAYGAYLGVVGLRS